MIKTQYEIDISVDDENFSVTLKEPNEAQREELGELSKGNIELYEKRAELVTTLDEKNGEFAINKELISCSSIGDKLSLLLEQKKLYFETNKLKREIDQIDKSLRDASKALSNLYAKRFDLLVGGAGKSALEKVVQEKGISYVLLFENFASLASKAKEKK
jgi:hypothetical protein